MQPDLFYWNREKRGSAAEVDYLFPFEKGARQALRFNSDLPSNLLIRANTSIDEPATARLLSLPLYLVEQWPRLMASL
jgi:hypothetical protein